MRKYRSEERDHIKALRSLKMDLARSLADGRASGKDITLLKLHIGQHARKLQSVQSVMRNMLQKHRQQQQSSNKKGQRRQASPARVTGTDNRFSLKHSSPGNKRYFHHKRQQRGQYGGGGGSLKKAQSAEKKARRKRTQAEKEKKRLEASVRQAKQQVQRAKTQLKKAINKVKKTRSSAVSPQRRRQSMSQRINNANENDRRALFRLLASKMMHK